MPTQAILYGMYSLIRGEFLTFYCCCFLILFYRLLERVSACVRTNEPILLVGDTGTGKTSTIQYLADVLRKKLIVLVCISGAIAIITYF